MTEQNFEWRYYQEEAPRALLNYFYEHTGNPIVALPTASGKSVVIPLFIKLILDQWFSTRFLVLTHVKELVEQNAKKMAMVLPNVPYGVNCDGLGRRDTIQPVVFGSVGSVLPMMHMIGYRDFIIIDEGHLANENEESQYGRVIGEARLINPNVKVICLSATPWTTRGSIIQHDDDGNCTSLFTHVAYDRTRPEDFAEFTEKGWLCRLIARGTQTKYDISNVGVTRGEYNAKQLQAATDIDVLTEAAVAEMIQTAFTAQRHCGLVFANGVKHAEHVTEEFLAQGSTATFVHSKLTRAQRDDRLEGYKAGAYQWMVNNGILTTGFDHPPIDIIGVLRHTFSIPLWVQMLGRGLRPYDWLNPMQYIPGFEYTKYNTMVLDFANNTDRLGPIDDPFFKAKKKKGDPGDAPVKTCENKFDDGEVCKTYNFAGARCCWQCGAEFVFSVKFEATAGTVAPMSIPDALPERHWHDVKFINYEKVGKPGMPAMLKVIYHCGLKKSVSELVCIEHNNQARQYAWGWWRQRTELPMPSTVDDALKETHNLKRPRQVEVETAPKIKYPKVTGHVF